MNFSITIMCRVLKVNISSYYHWIQSGSIVEKVDEELNKLIDRTFYTSNQTYDQRRIKEALEKKHGVVISKRRIGKIMKSLNLIPKTRRKFKVNTTDSNHNLAIEPNILDRDFYAGLADKKYVGDITYIHTAEGWLYWYASSFSNFAVENFDRKILNSSFVTSKRYPAGNLSLLFLTASFILLVSTPNNSAISLSTSTNVSLNLTSLLSNVSNFIISILIINYHY